MKKLTSILFISALLFSSNVLIAKAEDAVQNQKAPRGERADAIKQIRQEAKDTKENFQKEMESQKENIKAEREKINEQIKTLRNVTKQRMDDLKVKIKDGKDKATAKIQEIRIAGREEILKKFDEKVINLKTIKDKINTKIVAVEAKGVDTTNAKSFIAEAETKLTVIEGKITQMNAVLASGTDKLTAENKTKIITLKKEIQDALNGTHADLNNALKSIKEAISKRIPVTPTTNTN